MFGKKKYDVEITIEGMSCEHCSGRVEKCLNELDGVEAKVDLKKKTAYVNLQNEIDDAKLKETIENQGYKVINVKH